MSRKHQLRHIDHEFSTLSGTFDDKVRIIVTAANLYLEGDTSASDAHVVLSLIDLFLLLCYKWLKNRYIVSDDKNKIRSAQTQILDLRFEIFRCLNVESQSMNGERQPTSLYLPTTSDKEFADKLERMGMKNVYREGKAVPDPIERLEGTMASPRELAKLAEVPPMTLYLPTTSDPVFAKKLERMGYKNAYRPRIIP